MILASASPRRRELLTQIGVHFSVTPADIDETPFRGEEPAAYVERMAREKAHAIAITSGDEAVLGADTTVVCQGEILVKPADAVEAIAMLTSLSGRSHQVMTAVALAQGGSIRSQVVTTQVSFRALSAQEIQDYVATGEPMDKAGAYGIQGLGAILVADIQGSYSNVVGLPLTETAAMLREAGVAVWQMENGS